MVYRVSLLPILNQFFYLCSFDEFESTMMGFQVEKSSDLLKVLTWACKWTSISVCSIIHAYFIKTQKIKIA